MHSKKIVLTESQCHCIWEAAHNRACHFGFSSEDAEDCAISFLLHMLEDDNLLYYVSNANEKREGWLFTCADHWVHNVLRSHIRLKRQERSLDDLESSSAASLRILLVSATPETEMIRHELESRIQHAVKRLTPRQQSLFQRYFIIQDSITELAVDLGTTKNAVHQSLHVLRRRLYILLSDDTLDAAEAYDYLLFLNPRLVVVRPVCKQSS